MNIKNLLTGLILIGFLNLSFGQSVGIRAGLNYSTILGSMEEGESFEFTDGFHFGFNYGYKVTNKFTLRAELLYSQIGAKREYQGPGYFKIYRNDGSTLFERGDVELNLEISNAYINLPLVAAYQITPQFEIFAGASVNFLVNPVGRGTMRFESHDNPDCILFRQSLDYNYYSDNAQEGTPGSPNPTICIDGELLVLPRFAGAYYQYSDVQKVSTAFQWVDASLVGGINYFINKGFFFGLTVNYGLSDITKDEMDISIRELRPDNKFNYRNDRDINLSGQLSVGFRF